MNTVAVITVLALLVLAGLGLLAVSQLREKKRIDHMRRVRAIEDGRNLLYRFIGELPAGYLDRELKTVILERARALSEQLIQIGAPGNPTDKRDQDQAQLEALTQQESDNSGGTETVTDPSTAREVNDLLHRLYRFIETQGKQKRIPAELARQQLQRVRFLVVRTQADLLAHRAREQVRSEHYRRAIHGFHLAITELKKVKEENDAVKLINQYQKEIQRLERAAAEKEHPGAQSTPEDEMPDSVNREWDEFIHEEEGWKKKADYDN